MAAALGAAWACGCGGAGEGPADAVDDGRPLGVAATVGMVADVVREVGGGRLDVTQVCGSGVDPHLYKPTRDDVQALRAADAVFYCGLMLEGKMADTLRRMANAKPVVALAEGVDAGSLIAAGGSAHPDPHVWMDVSLWAKTAGVVAEALAEFDPRHAAEYRANAEAYAARLAGLHAYGRRVVGSVPEGRRVLVTSHDAFNYLGRAYGLEVQGVQGISTESEAGLRRVGELVDLLVDREVGAVFVESSVPRKSIESLIEGAAARGHQVVVGGELFSDAMGPAGTYEGTYVGMLDHNLTTIARALGGEAPEGGWRAESGGQESADE